MFFGVPKTEAKTILITSAAPGEGKSTVVSNLAISMAQAGQKVLVVDGDFRKPTQNQIFQLNHEEQGLSSVLAESLELDEAIQKTPIENLDVLTCGPHVANPSELLNSRRFSEVLQRLAERYDRVLLDSPPVGLVTDAQILGGVSQITILVLNTAKAKRKAVCNAYEALQAVNARVLGVIMNQVREGGGRYGYGSRYYGKDYGSYYKSDNDHGSSQRADDTGRD